MLSVGKVFGLLDLQDNFSAKLLQASTQLKTFSTTTEKLGRSARDLGDKLTMGITLPVVGLAAASLKASIDFESSFAGVRKTFDSTGLTAEQTEERLAELSDSIREMSLRMPTSAIEINKVAEAAGQLGVKRDDVLAFSETMVKLGETTNLTADQAATSFARFANIMGTPTDRVDELGSALVHLGNTSATTEAEIVEMSMRIAGAAKTVGMTEGQVLGLAASLSSLGIEAEMGGSAISKTMINIASAVEQGGQKLNDFAEIAGMSAERFTDLFTRDSGTAIAAFVEGLGKVEERGDTLIGTLGDLGITETRLRDTMLRVANAGDLVSTSMRGGTEAMAENEALSKEYNERLKTTESQLKMLRNRIYDVAVTLGEELAPHLLMIMDAAKPLVELMRSAVGIFAGLPRPVQTFGLALVGVGVAAGPVLSIGGRILELFAAISKVLGVGTATAAAGGLAGKVAAFGATLASLAVPTALAGIAYGLWRIDEAARAANKAMTEGRLWEHITARDDNTWIRQRMGLNVETQVSGLLPKSPLKGMPKAEPKALPSDWMTSTGATSRAGSTPISGYAADLGEWNKQIAGLSGTMRGQLTQALKDGVLGVDKLAESFGVSAEAIKLFETRQGEALKVSEEGWDLYVRMRDAQDEWNVAISESTFELSQNFRAARLLRQEKGQLMLLDFVTYVDAETAIFERLNLQLEHTAERRLPLLRDEQEKAGRIIAFATEKIENQERAFTGLADGLIELSRNLEGFAGDAIYDIGRMVGSVNELRIETEKLLKDQTASWGDYARNVGSWAGLIIGYVKTVASWLERDTLTAVMVNDFKDAHGGIHRLRAEARLAGVDLTRAFNTDSAATFRREVERIEAAISESQERMQRYGLTWRDFGDSIRQSQVDTMTRQLLIDWKALERQGVDTTRTMASALSNLVIEAKNTGTKIPGALQPMLDAVARAGLLTEDAVRALMGLEDDGVPSLQQISDAAARYGIELDKLGPKVNQLRINEAAAQIAADFELLIGLGGDSNEVLTKMSDKVQDIVNKALTMGLTIPESMRPVIQAMIDAGLLTDEFGSKLTDTSRLNFAKPLTVAIEDLISKIGELIDKFSEVGTAAEEGFGRARGAAEATGRAVPRGALPEPATQGPGSSSEPGSARPREGLMGIGRVYLDGRQVGSILAPHIGEEVQAQGVV